MPQRELSHIPFDTTESPSPVSVREILRRGASVARAALEFMDDSPSSAGVPDDCRLLPGVVLGRNNRQRSPDIPARKILQPGERVQVDIDRPFSDISGVVDRLGLPGNLVATVEAADQTFYIIDRRVLKSDPNTKANKDFLIVDTTYSKERATGYKGVSPGEPVIIGRGQPDRFTYSSKVSSNHFRLEYIDGDLSIINQQPTNFTAITAHVAPQREIRSPSVAPAAVGGRTIKVQDRLRVKGDYGEGNADAPHGYYAGYPILGKKSKQINNGVYLGASQREAIRVDGESRAIKRVYRDVLAELRRQKKEREYIQEQDILQTVLCEVRRVMPPNADVADKISGPYREDKVIKLSEYIKGGAGICRHQGLLAACLVEKLINDDQLPGNVIIERNSVPALNGAHGWATYESKGKPAIVIDPAQNFVGTKEQAIREGRWNYHVPDER